jgi:hypothetical protein
MDADARLMGLLYPWADCTVCSGSGSEEVHAGKYEPCGYCQGAAQMPYPGLSQEAAGRDADAVGVDLMRDLFRPDGTLKKSRPNCTHGTTWKVRRKHYLWRWAHHYCYGGAKPETLECQDPWKYFLRRLAEEMAASAR